MNLKTAEKLFFIAQRKAKMNIEQYFNELIKREGGYLNNPIDRGGATKFGITEGSHVQVASKLTCEVCYQVWPKTYIETIQD